jgi:excisionase family DNA binding protein
MGLLMEKEFDREKALALWLISYAAILADKDRPPVWKPEKPLLLNDEQAALYLNISPRMVRTLIRDRKLIPKFIGRRCLIPTAQVEKYARKVAGE